MKIIVPLTLFKATSHQQVFMLLRVEVLLKTIIILMQVIYNFEILRL